MSELNLAESLAIVTNHFVKVLYRNRRKKFQYLDRVGIAFMDLILNIEALPSVNIISCSFSKDQIPTSMQLYDYLCKQGMKEKSAIAKCQLYYERIIKPLEALEKEVQTE